MPGTAERSNATGPVTMRLLSETDREYLKATVKAWWFILASAIMGALRLLEKWWHIGIDIPNWALESLIFLSLSLAQFEAYKRKFISESLTELDFHFDVDNINLLPARAISGNQDTAAQTSRAIVAVFNTGKKHFHLRGCRITYEDRKTLIHKDIIILPSNPEVHMDVTSELLGTLGVIPIDFRKSFGTYRVSISVFYASSSGEAETDPRLFDVTLEREGASKRVQIRISPALE
jgi:hypothetical protein